VGSGTLGAVPYSCTFSIYSIISIIDEIFAAKMSEKEEE
jgi:hypothetical protein